MFILIQSKVWVASVCEMKQKMEKFIKQIQRTCDRCAAWRNRLFNRITNCHPFVLTGIDAMLRYRLSRQYCVMQWACWVLVSNSMKHQAYQLPWTHKIIGKNSLFYWNIYSMWTHWILIFCVFIPLYATRTGILTANNL